MSSEKSACPGGVEQVDYAVLALGRVVRELQRRRGDGDTPGLFHLHPVRHRGPRPALPWMAPAWVMILACSTNASVSVDLPASGWLMTAKVRRRPASVASRFAAAVDGARVSRS